MPSKNALSRKLFFLTFWDSLALTAFSLAQCIFSSPDNQSTDTAPWLEAERIEFLTLVLNTSATSNSEEHIKGGSVRSEAEGCVEEVESMSSSFVTSRETPSQISQSSKAPQGINWGTLQCRFRQLTSHCFGSAAALFRTL